MDNNLRNRVANALFGHTPEGHCVSCKREAGTFRDEASAREWSISQMCQRCQDVIFRDDEAELIIM